MQTQASSPPQTSLLQVFLIALRLGLTSFGGPVAHLGYFQAEYLTRRKWLDEATYADLVALCQFLPGPASSQVIFGIGLSRRGLVGGLACWLGFTLPSALLMFAAGSFANAMGHIGENGWFRGLKIAAVAVVAQAVWSMGGKLCPDRSRLTIALCAAMLILTFPAGWMPVVVILLGGSVGWCSFRRDKSAASPAPIPFSFSHAQAAAVLLLFFGLLFLLPFLVLQTRLQGLAYFDSFYRTGALVFGGGHVVLPLLKAEVVRRLWVDDNTLVAGYGLAQALPGPLFSFAAYLGTVARVPPNGWQGALLCLCGIYLSPLLLMLGVLPFWETLRRTRSAPAVLKGANAAVVGILLAAFYDPIWVASIHHGLEFALALASFGLLTVWKCPSWLVVVLAGAAGGLWL